MKRDSMYRSLESVGQTGNRPANPPPEEPDALVAHVRVCEGPGRQRPGLLGKFLEFLPHAGIIAVLAGLMQFLNFQCPYIIAWAGFAAWACYFLAGCTIKGGAKVIGCWVFGVAASVAIMELGGALAGKLGATAAFTIAAGFVAFFVILFEKVPALDMIPAWFIGAACFFGYSGYPGMTYKVSVPSILVTCVVGQVFGFVTVLLRTKYGKMVEAGEKGEPGK